MKFGQSKTDISPPQGLSLFGYPNSHERPNDGVETPLFAKALAFESDNERALLITCDLLGLDTEFGNEIRTALHQQTGINPSQVMLAATHTHSGPVCYDCRHLCPDPIYYAELKTKIVAVGVEALGRMVEANISVGATTADIAFYRIVQNDDGQFKNKWVNRERVNYGPTDKEVSVVTFTGPREELLAVLFNYACHPVTMGPTFTKVSADFPGYATQRIEAAYPGAIAVYTNGGCGNLNPYDCVGDEPQIAENYGNEIADAVLQAMANLTPLPTQDIAVRTAIAKLTPLDGFDLSTFPGLEIELGAFSENSLVKMPVQAMRIGPVALVAVPGELCVQTSLMMKALSSDAMKVIPLGYTNGVFGYLPSDSVVQDGGGKEVATAFCHDVDRPLLAATKEALNALECR